MDLRQAVIIWRRRRILTVSLLVLAVVAVALAQAKVPRYYQSASSMVLLASRDAAKANGNNPFLSFSPSLTLTADAVSRELTSPGTAGKLARQGFTSAYTVALPPYTTSTTGSVLLVTATGADPADVERTLQAVDSQVGTELAQLQHGIPAHGQVRARTLSLAPNATLNLSQTARMPVAACALLLVLCLGVPIMVDGLVARRRRRLEDWLEPGTTRGSHRSGSSSG